MKVSAKWPPDRVVGSLANQALFWGIALKPQTAEFDHDFIGTEWRHDVGAQRRTTQIEVHPWEKIDHADSRDKTLNWCRATVCNYMG